MHGARHAVILPPPKTPPAPTEPQPAEVRTNLKSIDWAQVPDAVVIELRFILELRCRKTSGDCFCGVHLVSQTLP